MLNQRIETQNYRNSDPLTSAIAGDENTKHRRLSQVHKVENMVAHKQGLTSAELAKAFDMDRHTIARRLPDSINLRRGEHRKCRVSGRLAVTWWVA